MKEKLIELLGLAKDVSEDAIVETVANLKSAVESKIKDSELEKKVQSKIRESGGALSRQQALEVINGQAMHNLKSNKK